MNSNSKGFTLLEILVALGIMAAGFLAMSQMQYLSLRQKTLAESGTFATNMIGTISDFEMADAKRRNLLNSRIYLDSQASKTIINQDDYCDGSDDAICEECPCNPLEVFVSDSFNLLAIGTNTENSCAILDPNNIKPGEIEFTTDASCIAVQGDDDDDDNDVEIAPFYIFRTVTSTFDNSSTPNQINMNIRYVLKTARQFNDPDNKSAMGTSGTFANFLVGDSVAKQNFQLSAHVERDWTNFVMLDPTRWNEVIVPHIP